MTSTELHSSGPSRANAVAAYRQVRRATAELLAQRPPDAAVLPVPHCPEWKVRDLVVHLVEICARVHGRITGSVPGVVDGGLSELLPEWERLSGPVEEFLARNDSMDRHILVMDAFTHELDLRQALGVAPPVDHPALAMAYGVLLKGLSASLDGHGLPPLAVETEHWRAVAGTGEPAATVAGPWHEVYLSLAGRRSTDRIRSLRWSADPGRWLPAFTWGPFRVPETSVAAPVR